MSILNSKLAEFYMNDKDFRSIINDKIAKTDISVEELISRINDDVKHKIIETLEKIHTLGDPYNNIRMRVNVFGEDIWVATSRYVFEISDLKNKLRSLLLTPTLRNLY